MNVRTLTAGLLLAATFTLPAHAALEARYLDGSTTANAYYDTTLNITWLANANLAASNTFGVSGIVSSGYMNWTTAQSWIAAMNAADYLGYSDWRLPMMVDTGTAGCNYAYSGTDCGYNVQTTSGSTVYSEMASLYYDTLGNQGYYTTTGADSGAYDGGANPNSTLDNTGPFQNFQSYVYWSGTEYAPHTLSAWYFFTGYGLQFNYGYEGNGYYALAVRPGDVAAVPEPGSYALMLAGLGLVGVAARRRRG